MEKENKAYLTEQIITYIGNKRKLLNKIEAQVKDILEKEGKDKVVCADLFSGSGIVARMLKQYSTKIYVNDMEDYSRIINECYLTNKDDIDWEEYNKYAQGLKEHCEKLHDGIISDTYSPKDENNIASDDRVFYTKRNAQYIDTAMEYIQTIPEHLQPLFIAPLLHEASVHVNTSGVFKGFYKNTKTKKGQFGGDGQNCLDRIKGNIEIKKPVLSDFNAEKVVLQGDTNEIVKDIDDIDIAYLDPPYNQHGYGSNYFMLNTIGNYKLGDNLSKVSGIPDDWNRSAYNVKTKALNELTDLISNLKAKYIIISYNSDGFISKEEMEDMLKDFGNCEAVEIKYNTFRGCRHLSKRSLYVNEYLFVLTKINCGEECNLECF